MSLCPVMGLYCYVIEENGLETIEKLALSLQMK